MLFYTLTLLTLFQIVYAQEVDVFLAAGQSNAKATWSTSIEMTLNRLRPEKETVVAHSYHPGNWLYAWWNDSPQNNYYDNLTALETEFSELRSEGKEPIFRGVFWFQGEGDSGSYSGMNLYKDRFKSYLDQLELDMEVDQIKSVIVVIDGNQDSLYDDPTNSAGRTRAQIEYMRNIHFELGSELNGFAVDSRDYQRGDLWHLSSAELDSLGKHIGEKYFLDYWLSNYTITGNGSNLENERFKMSFSAPSGILNWTVYRSDDLSEWTPLLRSEKMTSEPSNGDYQVEVLIEDPSKSSFYKVASPE